MPRSHLSPKQLRLVLVLLALLSPLFFMSGQAGAQKKRKAAPRAAATPAASPQTTASQQTAQKSQKSNLVRMRSSDTSDGSNVTLESDGVLNKYSAYRSGDKFYVVVPDLDAQRAQSNLRGRGFDNVQVQKTGNDTVLVFRMQPGAKASVRQRFNRLDVVFNTPGGATEASQGGSNQTQSTTSSTGSQSNTRTQPGQTQGATTTTAPNTGNATQPNTVTGSQTSGVNPDAPGASPIITTAPTPIVADPSTPVETPAASPEATLPTNEIAQAPSAPVTQPPASTSQRQTSTSPSLATTLARNWGLALIIGLILISLGLVIAARAKSRRSATDEKSKDDAVDAKPAKSVEPSKLKAVAPVTTAAVVTAKKVDKEKASAPEKVSPRESAVKETGIREVVSVEKDAAKEAVPVTTADLESASAEVRKLLAGESYDEAVVGTADRGTRQAVAAELLAALGSRNAEKRERAREAFVKHNYLDEATYDLRTAEAPGERASAARSLRLAQDQTATPHLIAALEDSSPEVRRAVIEALADLKDPSAVAPLEALLEREHDRKVPHGLIRRAIEASAAAPAVEEKEETTTIEAAAPAVVVEEETPTLEAAAPAVKEETQAVEPAPVEAATVEAAPVAVEDEKPAIGETAAVVASEAAALSLTDAQSIETPKEVSTPLRAEIVAPPQRAGNRKMRKKQARQKKAEEQTRKIAETEAARQKEQAAAAQAAAEAEAARLLAEEQERQRALEEEEARKRAEEQQRLEAEARQKAEEEAARLQAEAEALRKAEEEAQRKAEAEAARLRAEEEERLRAEEEARLRAQEEERQRAEAEARKKAEEEAERLRVEEERRQAEEAQRLAAAEAARLEAEAEAARLRAEEEARRQAEEEERRRVEEERQRLEAEAAAKRAEEERQRVEAEARARAEEEARQQAEAEARRKAEEEARLRAEEEARLRAEDEARRAAEAEEKRKAEEEAARLRAEEEARRQAEAEAARLRAAEEEAARQRAEEAARKQAEEEAARLAAEEAEIVRVTEADVITEAAPPVAKASELLIERNDGSEAGWVDIEVDDAGAQPVSPSSSELSPVALDSSNVTEAVTETAITEWQVSEQPTATHEAMPATAIEPVAETTAETPKDIDLAVAEKGIAHAEEDFSTVPHSILRHLGSEDSEERAEAVTYLGRLGGEDAFREISAAFDDPVQEVRNAAARALFELNTDRAASFTRALREAPMERRRNIGAALASSGLAGEAIGHLTGESREKTYDAFSLLFLMSKAGEVQPLMRAIEDHPNNEVRLAVVKLLALSGQQEILPAFRRLAVRGSLPTEVRSAVMEAIYQISSQSPSDASSRV